MNRWLVRKVLFPAKEALLGQKSMGVLDELQRTQWLSRDEHRARQWMALRAQLEHAYERVSFYREWMDAAGAKPGDIRSFDDYARLPIVSKQAYTEAGKRLIARGHERQVSFGRTSGSTGAPSIVPLARSNASIALAHAWRGRQWWGADVGDRELKFWGRSASFERTLKGKTVARLKLFKDRALNVRSVSPFDMSDDALGRIARAMLRDRPDVVFGYGQAILMFAEYLSHHGIDVTTRAPKVVVFTSEHLQPSQRAFMSRVFGAPVASEYGAVECGIIAYDAPCGSMHASDEALYLEQHGSPAGILVSHLSSWSAPILRYALGDLVQLAAPGVTCSCGRGLSLIQSMTGRDNDVIRKRNGEPIHAELFDYAMRHQPGVRRYRVVQNSLGSIEILLQMRERADPDALRRDLTSRLRPFLGDDVRVEVTQVAELPPTPSGKFQWAVSNVGRPSRRDTPL